MTHAARPYVGYMSYLSYGLLTAVYITSGLLTSDPLINSALAWPF